MYEGTYSNLPHKPKRRVGLLKEEKGLAKLLEHQNTPEEEDVIQAFVSDLKNLLHLETGVEVIEGIHSLEANLNKVEEQFMGLDVPKLADFYQDLSPLLLQKYWEQRKNKLSEEGADELFRESIFIALEEEIYIWQEKLS